MCKRGENFSKKGLELDLVVDIDKLGRDTQFGLDFLAEGAHAEDFGTVVAAAEQVETEFFAGNRNSFLDFTSHERITTESDSLFDGGGASRAAADGELFNGGLAETESVLHAVFEHLAAERYKIVESNRGSKLPHNSDGPFPFAEEPIDVLKTIGFGYKHVIADFHVTVERQVEAVKRDSILHQAAHALAKLAHKPAVFALPEAIRVMDDNAVGLIFDGGVDQTVAERDSRDDSADLVGGFDTKAIDAVILEKLRFKQVV